MRSEHGDTCNLWVKYSVTSGEEEIVGTTTESHEVKEEEENIIKKLKDVAGREDMPKRGS